MLLLLACAQEVVPDPPTPAAMADLLLVVDASPSMEDYTQVLAPALRDALIGLEGVDVQVYTTTTDSWNGAAPWGPAADADDATAKVICALTCWDNGALVDDATYECPDGGWPDLPDPVSREYLHCLCGVNAWMDQCGSGDEQPLAAIEHALCELDPEGAPVGACNALGYDQEMRQGAPLVVLVVTDEGDASQDLASGESDPSLYLDRYAAFGRDVQVFVWGPNPDVCQGSGVTFEVERLTQAADATDGAYSPIRVAGPDDSCEIGDPSVLLSAMSGALRAHGS